jgi:RNA polymerase sigma factor (sigma-70 family)
MRVRVSPDRRKIAVIAAWVAVVAGVMAAISGAVGLAVAIQTDEVGAGICVPVGGLVAIALCTLGPAAWAKLNALWRRSARALGHEPVTAAYRPHRRIEAEERWLERVMQDTRSILRDMDHLAARAEWWPSDGVGDAFFGRVLGRLAGSLGSGLADFSDVNRITRDVWDWVRTVEGLSAPRRRHLAERGIDVERLRQTLLGEADFHRRFQAMVHLLRRYEDALFSPAPDPFRGVRRTTSTVASRGRGADSTGTLGPRLPTEPMGDEERQHERAFVTLVRQCALRKMAAEFARTPADREDLYQDMVLAIWKALPQFRGESSIATYAQRIAYSTAVDYVRRRRVVVPEVDIEDPAANPEQRLGRAMAGARLRDAIEKLPGALREALVLHLQGHGYRSIAERTGTSEGNVGARLTRARDRLRRRLGTMAPA